MVTREDLVARFTWIDYSVFGLMLVVSAGIGIYHGCIKRASDTKEFLMAGKNMSPIPVALSLIASFMSAITLLGTASEIYLNGLTYWLHCFSYSLVGLATIFIYLPVFWDLQLTSAYEYLEKRFNKTVRRLGSFIFMLQMCIYMAIVVYAPALALSQVTGIDVYVSVSTMCIVCIFYTTIGGMKAVLWTDSLQVFIMFGSMMFVVVKGTIDQGGIMAVWEANARGNRTEIINFDTHPTTRHSIWSLVIGGYFLWTYIYGCNQAQVQRYLCVREKRSAIQAIVMNCAGIGFLLLICVCSGLVVYAKYEDCDPISSGLVNKPDQLLPLFVMDTLGSFRGFPGIFVAGIFSGALSTVSSGINSLAAITLEDFIKPFVPSMTEKRATNLSKLLSLFFGVTTFVLVFVAEQLGNVLAAALGIHGMVGGPLLGLFTLGMLFPWANSTGAAVGTICGIFCAFFIGVGIQVKVYLHEYSAGRLPVNVYNCVNWTTNANLTDLNVIVYEEIGDISAIYKVSYMWYAAIGCITVVVVGMLVSLLTGSTDLTKIDPRLLSPVFHSMKRFLPGGNKIRDSPRIENSLRNDEYEEKTYHLANITPDS